MNKGLALVAATSLTALAAPAFAQDSTFTGPRVEALIGYDIVRPGSTTDIDNNDDVDQSINGAAYGVGAGFDVAMGSAVIGVEGEYSKSEAQTDFDTAGITNFGVGNVDAGRDIYLGVRAGVRATPNMLAYAKAGYTNTKLNVLSTDNTTDTQNDVSLDGWRVGGGLEYALNTGIYLKTEYRYSNYQEGEFEAPSGLESDRFDVDLDRHQVMAGVGFRF